MHMSAVEATHHHVQVQEHEQLEHAVHIQQQEDVLEESKQEHEEEGEESIMYENDPGSGDETAIDTTEDFLKIFQGKTEFDSWEEFSNLFEDFQRVTGSAYKPRSATSIEYANERRNKDKIDDRFVYQTVKMVCQNFGVPVKKENSVRKTKKYVGLGCEAMVHLRYKQGSLNIVSCNLEHKNHSLHCGHEIVSVRSFSFTDEVDFMIAKVSLEHNPFTAPDQDRQWNVIVRDLQQRDVNLKTVNMRMVKKRVRFLIDRYMSNINGKTPLPDDEMGIILYELAQTRQDAVDNPPRGRGRPPKRKRGRPRKYRQESDSDMDQDITNDFMDDDMDDYPALTPKKIPYTPAAKVTSRDITSFLEFLQRKDEQDRKMRQSELDLRREELDLHKREMELQKNKFEFERVERQAHLDLLKAQLDAFTMGKPRVDKGQDGQEGITEYTIVVNNDEAFANHAQAHVVQ